MDINKKLLVRFIKFGIVGGSGVIVNNGLLWLFFKKYGMPLYYSSLIAIVISIYTNFSLNDIWTWSGRVHKHSYWHRVWRYYIAASLSAAINYTILLLLNKKFDVNYIIANLIGIGFGMFINFWLGERWIFRSTSK